MNKKFLLSLLSILVFFSFIVGCGPKTPIPIVPMDGDWVGIDDRVLHIKVKNGNVVGIYWNASDLVFIDGEYKMMQINCGIDGGFIPVQADGTFAIETARASATGKFDTPASGHVIVIYKSCKAHEPTQMLPVSVDFKQPLTSNTTIQPEP